MLPSPKCQCQERSLNPESTKSVVNLQHQGGYLEPQIQAENQLLEVLNLVENTQGLEKVDYHL